MDDYADDYYRHRETSPAAPHSRSRGSGRGPQHMRSASARGARPRGQPTSGYRGHNARGFQQRGVRGHQQGRGGFGGSRDGFDGSRGGFDGSRGGFNGSPHPHFDANGPSAGPMQRGYVLGQQPRQFPAGVAEMPSQALGNSGLQEQKFPGISSLMDMSTAPPNQSLLGHPPIGGERLANSNKINNNNNNNNK